MKRKRMRIDTTLDLNKVERLKEKTHVDLTKSIDYLLTQHLCNCTNTWVVNYQEINNPFRTGVYVDQENYLDTKRDYERMFGRLKHQEFLNILITGYLYGRD